MGGRIVVGFTST